MTGPALVLRLLLGLVPVYETSRRFVMADAALAVDDGDGHTGVTVSDGNGHASSNSSTVSRPQQSAP